MVMGGWLKNGGGSRGRVVGQISSLQLWRRNKLIWQWQMNHLLFPNCQFSSSPTPFSHPQSLPYPPAIFSPSFFNPSSSFFTYQALFPNSVIYFLPSFCSCSLWCSFTALPPTITFPYSLFCFRPVARAISELFFCFFLAFWKRGAAAFYHKVVYLVRRVDRPTPAHTNDFPASVSCHRCD